MSSRRKTPTWLPPGRIKIVQSSSAATQFVAAAQHVGLQQGQPGCRSLPFGPAPSATISRRITHERENRGHLLPSGVRDRAYIKCQSVETEPIPWLATTWSPSICHSASRAGCASQQEVRVAVVVVIADIRDVPTLGSPTRRGVAEEACAVHLPHHNLAVRVVVPDNIGLAVAVEIPGTRKMEAVAHVCEGRAIGDLAAVHLPHRDLGAFLQQQIGLAVAIEVGCVLDGPAGCDGADILRRVSGAIHVPQLDLTVVVEPQHLGLAVTGEVVNAANVPACSH